MPVTRRRLMLAAGTASAFMLAERGVRVAGEAIGSAARAMRPAPNGTSATRCALCGSPDHTMLDGRCPRALRGA